MVLAFCHDARRIQAGARGLLQGHSQIIKRGGDQ